ncbi:Membrane protein insertase YidC [Thalassocella blandensis]|nr:Membrane protein insertase YidC [Thalassocella blandensis]
MIWLRYSLIGGIFFVAFLLLIRWNDFDQRRSAALAPQDMSAQTQQRSSSDFPESQQQTVDDDYPEPDPVKHDITESASTTSTQLIAIKTNTLDVLIDPVGGDIVKVALPQYKAKIDQPKSAFLLLTDSSNHTYIAQSGLIGKNGTHTKEKGRSIYSSSATQYSLKENAGELKVDLKLTQEDGTQITKRFTFTRDSYLINIEYLINNTTSAPWQAKIYGRIKRDNYVPPSDIGIGIKPFVGAAITTPETNYKKMDFDDVAELNKPFEIDNKGGWVAMVQHYFMSAWVPDAEQMNHYSIKQSSNKLFYLEYKGEYVDVPPNSQGVIKSSYYAGPKIIKTLEEISPHLDLTIDFSWLWFISKPLFIGLDKIHGLVGNWGIAIILLTILVKLIFFYPSAMSYRSMAKMRKVMPLMKELKERYGDDRQRMSVETMKLYKKEGVNPLGGCLPMLLQMPVFLALYWALMESVELRHSPFFFWITDLSVKDPYFVLPLIMGATMFLQQKLNPAPQDPMQAKIMQMMPIFFTLLFMMFPAGLVLYWVTNNCLSIAQQYVITRQIEQEGTKS